MSASSLSTIIEAVLVNSDGECSQDRRLAAYECIKQAESNETVLLSLGVALWEHVHTNSTTNTYTQAQRNQLCHYALHCIELVITRVWNQLENEQRSALKQNMVGLVDTIASAPHTPQLFQYTKIAQLVSEIAMREWPQRWKNMMDELSVVAAHGPQQSFVVTMIVRNLADQVKAFNPNLPDQRRKEIQLGLNASLDELFPFCKQFLFTTTAQLRQSLDQAADMPLLEHAVVECMLCVNCIAEFCPDELVFNSELIMSLCNCLDMRQCFEHAIDILSCIASRKRSHVAAELQPALYPVWNVCLSVASSLAVEFDGSRHVRARFIDKSLSLLSSLLRSWVPLITDDATIRHRTMHTLLQLVQCDILSVRRQVAELWLQLYRSTVCVRVLLSDDIRNMVVSQLFQSIVIANVKESRPSLESHVDFDTADEAIVYAANLRSLYLNLVSVLVKNGCARVCLSLINQRLPEVLAAPITDGLSALGMATVNSTVFRHYECLLILAETIVRSCDRLGTIDASIPAHDTVYLLLKYTTGDPLMLSRTLAAFAALTPVYNTDELATAVVQRCFHCVTFRTQSEQSTPIPDLCEDTRATRRRACYSLLSISDKMASAMLPVFSWLVEQSISLVQQGMISDQERLYVFELLVAISNGVDNAQTQHDFIMSILSDPLQQWSAPWMVEIVSDPARLTAMVLSDDAATVRDQFRSILNALVHVLKRLPWVGDKLKVSHQLTTRFKTRKSNRDNGGGGGGDDDDDVCTVAAETMMTVATAAADANAPTHPSMSIIQAITPNTIALVHTLHAIWSPSFHSTQPSSLLQTLCHPSGVEVKSLTGDTVLKDERANDQIHAQRCYLNNTRELSYTLVSILTTVPQFYSGRETLTNTVTMLFEYVEYMELAQLKMFVEKVVEPLVKQCPHHCQDIIVIAAFTRVFTVVNTIFQQHRERVATTVDQTNVRYDSMIEKQFVELSRAIGEVVHRLLRLSDPFTYRKLRVIAEQTPRQTHPVTAFVMSNSACRTSYCVCGLELLRMSDSLACHLGCSLVFNALHYVIRAPHGDDEFCAAVVTYAIRKLSQLRSEMLELTHNELITVISEYYRAITPRSPILRQVLLGSIPGLTQQHIHNLEDGLEHTGVHEVSKNNRLRFRQFLLEFVIGKASVSEGDTARIDNLPETLVINKSSTNGDGRRDDYNGQYNIF